MSVEIDEFKEPDSMSQISLVASATQDCALPKDFLEGASIT